MRKVILYISMSLDGYIATKNDDISWLDQVMVEGEDYGYNDFYKDIDTYIVGKNTYDVILTLTGGTLPQARNLDCYVITRQNIEKQKNITFYNQDIESLIVDLRSKEGKNIVCDGGGQIVKLLMEKNLIDEYVITVIPTILGDGKRLFVGGVNPIDLKALPCKSFDSGVVQLHYVKQ
ncbi:dihydrofolate reductase family protein [Halosquirtibacter xylanolyticus]|uniref:dihydrofolate reductase family protein n=1 Tax=Halosquirtibacter xylanolyticus TaxID=3374599 RepID=UPI003747CCB3|nr:dihydrofolate reductase family protein [Prolixibacteraceae bacterium]